MTSNLPATQQAKALAAAAQEERATEFGKMLKFNKGKYFIGDDEVKVGHQYIAHTSQWTRGWVKFIDNQPIDRRIGKVVDGFRMPERDELGDTDASKWEVSDGERRDPWAKQTYLPLVDVDSGEIVVFVSGSHGGRGAVGDLCDMASKNWHRGQPKIKLGIRSYKHKKYGRIENPEFQVIGWTELEEILDNDSGEIAMEETPF